MNMIILSTLFMTTSTHLGLPPGLLASLCYVESRHKPSAINQYDGNSPSYGICQIKLATAQLVGFVGTEKELMHPKTNVFYAAKYLKRQLTRYNNNVHKAVAAYNSGTYKEIKPGLALNHLYVTKVLATWSGKGI